MNKDLRNCYSRMVDETVLIDDTLKDTLEKIILKDDDVKLFLLHFLEFIGGEEKFCHDNKNLLGLLPYILKLQNRKEGKYGRSWCKHGEIGAFENVTRKYDRIENIMLEVMQQGLDLLDTEDLEDPTETFLDTIIDLGVYSLMWAGLIREKRPNKFEKFVVSNKL